MTDSGTAGCEPHVETEFHDRQGRFVLVQTAYKVLALQGILPRIQQSATASLQIARPAITGEWVDLQDRTWVSLPEALLGACPQS